MAGPGRAPKHPKDRARRNADVVEFRVLDAVAADQPELPDFTLQVTVDGELESQSFEWPEPTRAWWKMLASHPLVREFSEPDWQFLLETARIHAAFWLGDVRLGNELRLREAKYGFTPEDRLRLRLQFAQTDEAEERMTRRKSSGSDSRDRRGPLKSA